MFTPNPATACDFYKVGHKDMYPLGTNVVYSNFTPRSNKLSTGTSKGKPKSVIFFGLQHFIKWFLIDYFNAEFFAKPREEVLAKYERRMNTSLGNGVVGSGHIGALHDLGYLPIEIKALPEGSLVPIKVPAFVVKNTLPEFFWLTNYLETVFSCESWKAITSATTAFEYRVLLTQFAKDTGASQDFVLWQGHDFSMRGMSGLYDAASSGSGHLTAFLGTDTIPAIDLMEYSYHGLDTFVGGSVPATEHSVMCAGGKSDELETFRRIIKDVVPSGIVSVVSDTWDYWKVITEYAATLKDDILSRKPNALGMAKVVFRPDSGDPVQIICGKEVIEDYTEAGSLSAAASWVSEAAADDVREETPHGECGDDSVVTTFKYEGVYYKVETSFDWNRYDKQYYYIDGVRTGTPTPYTPTPEDMGSVECLWNIFGGTINELGYKTLNQRVGLIYGDSITLARAEEILKRLKAKGFASDNVVFGIGSYTYQYITRDTYGFAMKATYSEVSGEGHELFKDPVTDSGTKKSAKGLLRIETENGEYVLYDQQSLDQEQLGELKTVFKDGVLVVDQTLVEIRQRVTEAVNARIGG